MDDSKNLNENTVLSSSGRDILILGVGFLFVILFTIFTVNKNDLAWYLMGTSTISFVFIFLYFRRPKICLNQKGFLIQNYLENNFISRGRSVIVRVVNKSPWWLMFSKSGYFTYFPTLVFIDKITGECLAESSLVFSWEPKDLQKLKELSAKYNLSVTYHDSIDKYFKEGAFRLFTYLNNGRFAKYNDVFEKVAPNTTITDVWPIWVMFLSAIILGSAATWLLIWRSALKLGKKSSATFFFIIGLALSLGYAVIAYKHSYPLTTDQNKGFWSFFPLLNNLLGLLFCVWFYKAIYEDWSSQNLGKTKLHLSVIGWALLGQVSIFVTAILVIALFGIK